MTSGHVLDFSLVLMVERPLILALTLKFSSVQGPVFFKDSEGLLQ